jgi:hypothetical protein
MSADAPHPPCLGEQAFRWRVEPCPPGATALRAPQSRGQAGQQGSGGPCRKGEDIGTQQAELATAWASQSPHPHTLTCPANAVEAGSTLDDRTQPGWRRRVATDPPASSDMTPSNPTTCDITHMTPCLQSSQFSASSIASWLVRHPP